MSRGSNMVYCRFYPAMLNDLLGWLLKRPARVLERRSTAVLQVIKTKTNWVRKKSRIGVATTNIHMSDRGV